MHERCKRLCGEERENCFISNKKQILCLTDMVINKITGISALLQIIREEINDVKTLALLERADREMQALVDWIRFLEVAGDLREFLKAQPELRDPERRREPRFPVTKTLREMIRLDVEMNGVCRTVDIINMSNRGLLFSSSQPAESGSVLNARLVFVRTPLRERSFHLHVIYSHPRAGVYLTGCEVSPEEKELFDIFKSVYEYIEDEAFRQAMTDE